MPGAVCPCDVFVHPRPIDNPPGRDTIAYRVGDYLSFRRALLLSRPGEIELLRWHPEPSGDLALQLVEWWAYLADILTFYDERAATEAYLRTAQLPESARRLVRLLGYRPRPGIGATVSLAARLSASGKAPPRAVDLDVGFAVQSKPGPGQEPQIFELDTATTVAPPDAVDADAPPDAVLQGKTSVLLRGTVTSVKENDRLLFLAKGFGPSSPGYALVQVTSLTPEPDPRGKPCTRLAYTLVIDALPAGATVDGYQLMRATQTAHPWLFLDGAPALTSTRADLESVSRAIKVGDAVLFEGQTAATIKVLLKMGATGGSKASLIASWKHDAVAIWKGLGIGTGTLAAAPLAATTQTAAVVRVTSYSETAWYANGEASAPGTAPTSTTTPAIPILHSVLGYDTSATVAALTPSSTTVSFAWKEVAPLLPTPATTMTETTTTLTATSPAVFPIGSALPVLLEDAQGLGVAATLSSSDGVTATLIYAAGTTFSLLAPVRVLFGLLAMSRGETVAVETLGSGDSTVAGQELALAKTPLTYLADTDPEGPGYRSTLTVWVDGVAWEEVQSFYRQSPAARVYVTREDDDAQTYVRFGDGVNGARLPTGKGNVTAQYRRGSGADAPAAGAITSILKSTPGLKSVRNPVAAGGGSDPDPASQLRALAPRSVLTFGRAVSADDWETLAAQAPGVTRARAYFRWSPAQQRALVTVYVGDDAAAVASALSALTAYADPNRPKVVLPARAVDVTLSLTIAIDAAYQAETVTAAVRAALLDDETGLFGKTRSRIGEAVYESQIDDVCLAIPGAVAVHALSFTAAGLVGDAPRFRPGDDGYFVLDDASLTVNSEVQGG